MQEAVNDSLSGGERRGTRRCGVIEFFADPPANLEQPFDLLLHRGRFSPFQLRWVSFQRYDGGNVRRQLSSRRKYAVKLGGVDPVVAGEGPGCWQPARVNSAPDCGLWLPQYLRGFAEVQHRQSLASGNLPRHVSEPD